MTHSSHRSSRAVGQRLADFPMVSEGIDNSSYAPAVWLVADGPNDGGSRCDGPFESGIRIVNDQHHPHRTTAKGLGAEIQVLRRLVSEPEFGVPHGQLSDDCSTVVDAEQFASSERCLVELDRPHPVSNREHWGYSCLLILGALQHVTQRKVSLSADFITCCWDIIPCEVRNKRRKAPPRASFERRN